MDRPCRRGCRCPASGRAPADRSHLSRRGAPRPTGRRLRRIGFDPVAAALLVGSGVTERSCTPAAVHDVKAAIRQVDLAACRQLAVRDLVSASKK
jgi:hypothetical protein